jgi:four helix bundle protein
MNNIAEGFGKYSRKEFIRYLDIAGNSAAEVKSILYVLTDLNYLPDHEVTILQGKAEEVRALCLGMIKYLANSSKPTT